MNWGSDELQHRSAELSGWRAELRAADPADVDGTVAGAVEYAAATSPGGDADVPDADALDADSYNADALDAESYNADGGGADDVDPSSADSDPRCEFCDGEIPEGEAVDASGVPVPTAAEFEWVGDTAPHHQECVPDGKQRFLPWAANGVLGDECAE